MYGELLDMQRIFIGYHKLVHADGRSPEIGFEHAPMDPPPQWPDPEHPQQVHLDIAVGDLDGAASLVLSHGASRLRDSGHHRVFADPVGHPFCLYVDPASDAVPPGRIARIVFDCPSPRALAAFYEDPPRWPDPAHPAQLHLDLSFDDASAVALATELGATRRALDARPDNTVYADPAGHPFCLGIGGGWTSGPGQVADYEAWLAAPAGGE